MFRSILLSFFLFSVYPNLNQNSKKVLNFDSVYMYVCNETDAKAYFSIVYQSGFEIFSDNWRVKGTYEVAPNECGKILITSWGSKIGKGYISAAFSNGDFGVKIPKYENKNSTRRQNESFTVIPNNTSLCIPQRFGAIDEVLEGTSLRRFCTDRQKVNFNLWFNQSSDVYEMTVYFKDNGYEISYKASRTKG